jgi:aspartate racemase
MPHHIGIVACSAEGASLCYRTICVEGAQLLGAHDHPEVSMHTHPLAEYMKCIYRGDWKGVGDMSDANSPLPTLDSTRLLARAALRRAVPGAAQPA